MDPSANLKELLEKAPRWPMTLLEVMCAITPRDLPGGPQGDRLFAVQVREMAEAFIAEASKDEDLPAQLRAVRAERDMWIAKADEWARSVEIFRARVNSLQAANANLQHFIDHQASHK